LKVYTLEARFLCRKIENVAELRRFCQGVNSLRKSRFSLHLKNALVFISKGNFKWRKIRAPRSACVSPNELARHIPPGPAHFHHKPAEYRQKPPDPA
jgi:hypothetical protein